MDGKATLLSCLLLLLQPEPHLPEAPLVNHIVPGLRDALNPKPLDEQMSAVMSPAIIVTLSVRGDTATQESCRV